MKCKIASGIAMSRWLHFRKIFLSVEGGYHGKEN
nr:MAG TPA: hypothetical protein [Caudoviricetes sp.]